MSPTKSISASTTPSTTALAERSPNTCSPTKTQTLTTKKMDAGSVPRFEHAGQKYTAGHGGQSQGQNQSQTYISPSDAIASPTTKKLSQIKGRRFMNAKPQNLFAKTLTKESLKMQLEQPNQGRDQE